MDTAETFLEDTMEEHKYNAHKLEQLSESLNAALGKEKEIITVKINDF